MLNKLTYFNISLSFWVEYFWLQIRKYKNRFNLRRANSKNIYKICLTFDSNEYKIVDKTSGKVIALFMYKESELIIQTDNLVSIKDVKVVIRAFFNNRWINPLVTF